MAVILNAATLAPVSDSLVCGAIVFRKTPRRRILGSEGLNAPQKSNDFRIKIE